MKQGSSVGNRGVLRSSGAVRGRSKVEPTLAPGEQQPEITLALSLHTSGFDKGHPSI